MKGYVENIEEATLTNTDFRRVLYTAKHIQIVVMAIPAGEEIGEEVHELDQFLRIEAGSGVAVLNGVERPIEDGTAVLVPAGTKHNIINRGTAPLKLYSLYGPPEHKDGIVHKTKPEADDDDEHFDGVTTE